MSTPSHSWEEILPMEVKMVIFEYLSIGELNNLRGVCKEWNDTLCSSKANLIWSDLVRNTVKGKLLFIPNDEGKSVQLTNNQLRKLAKLLHLKQQATLYLYNSNRQKPTKQDLPSEDDDDYMQDDSEEELSSYDEEELPDQSQEPTTTTPIEKLTDFHLIPQKELLTEEMEQIQNNSKEKTLISRGLEASTVDNTSQDIDCTRDARSRRKFWSSTGSKTTQANEHLTYQLQDPWFVVERERKVSKLKTSAYRHLDVVHQHVNISREKNPIDNLDYINQFSNIGVLYLEKMTICPFVASWQSNNCYSPKFISLSIGKTSDKKLIKITEDLPVEHNGNYQQYVLGPLVVIYERSLSTCDEEDSLVKSKAPIVEENIFNADEFETDDDEEDEEGGEQGRLMISVEDAMIALEASGGAFNERFMEAVQKLVRDKTKIQQMEQEEKRMLSQLACREHGDLLLRADLIGKVQTQPLDNLYYTCLEYFDLVGSAFTL